MTIVHYPLSIKITMDMLDPYLSPLGGDDDEFEIEPDMLVPASMRSGSREEIGSPAEVALMRRFIGDIRDKLDTLERLLSKSNKLGAEDVERLLLSTPVSNKPQGRIIEGVFDGEQMMGSDGKQYIVPSNYASKSKLVEGDILKLTITDAGSFIYKQIGPINRDRVIGKLAQDEVTGDHVVIADGKKWNVLLASVSFHRAEPGDDLVILVPKNAPSRWAAVENVIKKTAEVLEQKITKVKK